MLYFILQWAVREKEISNDKAFSHSYPTMASSSQTQGTSIKTDQGSDVLDGEEHVHIANNNAAGGKKITWIFVGGTILPCGNKRGVR